MKLIYIVFGAICVVSLSVLAFHQHQHSQQQEIQQVLHEANQSLERLQAQHDQNIRK